MNKRFIAILMGLGIAATSAFGFVGCGGNNNSADGGKPADTEQSGSQTPGTGDNEQGGGNGGSDNEQGGNQTPETGDNEQSSGNGGSNNEQGGSQTPETGDNEQGGSQTPETGGNETSEEYGTGITFKGVSATNTATSAGGSARMASTFARAVYADADTITFAKLRNENFYAHIELDNPNHYHIRSIYLTYAGKETPYAAYNFDGNSSWNDVYIKIPAKGAEDVSEYKVTKITYFDNDGKKFIVKLDANDSFVINVQDIRSAEQIAAPTFTLTGGVYSMTNYDAQYLDENGRYVIPSEHDGKPVAEIGEYAFAYREEIKELVIPDSIETIRGGAFYDCLNLEKVEIGTTEATKLFISYKNAFHGCENINYVNYSGTLEKWLNIRFGRTQEEQKASPDIPDYDNKQEYRQSNPTTHSWDLHINGELLTEVVVPESITEVRDFAFSRCQSIEKVVLHDGVKKVGYGGFLTNSGLRHLDLGNGIETIAANAFNGCYQLDELILPESLINLLGDNGGNSPFKACNKLFKITNNSQVPETKIIERLNGMDWELFTINGHRVNQAGNFLYEMTNTYEKDENGFMWMSNSEKPDVIYLQGYEGTAEEVTIPTTHNGKSVEIGACVFACNRTVKKIIVPEGFSTISNRFAASATALEEVMLPETLTLVGNHAFWNCKKLKKVTIPEGCTAFASSAFDTGATDLTITINSTQINYAGSSLKAKKLTVNYAGTISQFVGATQNEMGISNVYNNCKILVHCSDGDYNPSL